MFDRMREWWEQVAPRERRLMTLLGVTAVICVFGFIGFQISDGLSDMSKKNQATRDALQSLADHRDELEAAKDKSVNVVAMIGEESESLATYLESIEQEVGVKIQKSTEKPVVTKGKFHERALSVQLYDVTVDQLARFLERIETKSPIVVTQRLFVKRSSVNKEKLDRVEITVATYERTGGGGPKKEKAEARATATDAGSAQ
jgi:hypothetical protein